MQRLSATECITPAIDRTKLLLFSPFRSGRTWKLCATSYACRFGSMYLPFPLLYLAAIPAMRQTGAAVIVVIAIAVAVCLAVFTWVFHLCSRLQFAYFDIVANRGEFVAPAWRKYRPQALSWTAFKILLGTVFTAILSVPLIAWMRHIIPLLSHLQPARPGGPVDPQFAHVMVAMYGGYGLLMLCILGGMLVFGLLGDFILPSLALEDTGIREAFDRFGTLIRQEPGEFLVYVLLKTVLAAAAYFAFMVAWEIAFLLVTVIVGGVILLIGFALHAAGIPSLLLIAVGILLLILWYGVVIWSMIFGLGPVLTWMDAYAICFLGGRYPMLGDRMDRSTPASPTPTFQPYPAAYPPPVPPVV